MFRPSAFAYRRSLSVCWRLGTEAPPAFDPQTVQTASASPARQDGRQQLLDRQVKGTGDLLEMVGIGEGLPVLKPMDGRLTYPGEVSQEAHTHALAGPMVPEPLPYLGSETGLFRSPGGWSVSAHRNTV